MITTIAFDLDDTLWEVTPVIIRAEHRLHAWLDDAVPDLDHSREHMGRHRAELIQAEPGLVNRITEMRRRVIEATLNAGGTPDAFTLSHQAMEVFLAARNDVEFFTGALNTLGTLKLQYTLGALSNGNADIRRLGLQRVFSFAFSAEEIGKPKPAPDLFEAALRATGASAHEMVYVGDNPEHDIDAAKACGLHTVWVDNGKRQLADTHPDVTIQDIRDLPGAISQISHKLSAQ